MSKSMSESASENRKFAAIDIGTNSFHLVVVEVDEKGRYEILTREKEAVRLGSGAADMDFLTPEAMSRGVETLNNLIKLARSLGAEVRAVATSAVREANNRKYFLRRVEEECDLKVEVAPGQEEARLIYLGILQALPVYDNRILMMDIGGGSTEYLLGRGGVVEYSTSLKLGAIRLTERFFKSEPIRRSHIIEARKYVQVALARVEQEVRQGGYEIAVGSSGTIDTLAEMIRLQSPEHKDEELQDNESGFTAKQLDRIVNRIFACETREERRKLDGLDDKRADIILGGAIVLQESFRVLGVKKMLFSPFALREGIIFDTLEKLNLRKRLSPDIRRFSVEQMAENFSKKGLSGVIPGRHIAKLALNILEELRKLNIVPDLSFNDAFLLECGGILHNVGLLIAHSAHHKHGYYIIKNSEMLTGFNKREIDMIALLARYHRKATPSQKHLEYMKLPEKYRKKLNILGAILRIAIGLDRGGQARVARVDLVREDLKIVFNLQPALNSLNNPEDITLELWAARMKADWLEKVLNYETEFNLKLQAPAEAP